MAASSENPLPKSILIFNQIVEQVAQCAEKLADIRLPTHKHQDDMQAIQAKVNAVWECIPKASHTSEQDRLRAEIQSYTTKLEALQHSHELGLKEAWAEYERRADLAVKALCEALEESADTLLGSQHRGVTRASDFHHVVGS